MPRASVLMTTALVIGNTIGRIAPAAGRPGPVRRDNVPGWIATAAERSALALVFARLGLLVPGAGGHARTRDAFGDLADSQSGGCWVSIWVSNAAIATAAVGYLARSCRG